MKNQVNFVYDVNDDPHDEIKHWLFLENVRLQQERQEIAEEKQRLLKEKEAFEKNVKSQQAALELQEKKLCRQKELFEKQWHIMENELRRMARDRAAMEKERETLKKLQNQTRASAHSSAAGFFAGISGQAGLKKRYRELLKIYHPDNEGGDDGTVLIINQEYRILKRKYGID